MKHLYFVRHGLSEMNKRGFFSGRTETPLTREGIEQCHAAGRALNNAGIDCIVASPIKRAHDTAKIIAEEIGYPADKILLSEFFVERNFGPLEGAQYSEHADLDNTRGVEHSDNLIARTRAGWDYLQSLPADTILVVSHGAVGRALRHILSPDVPYHGTEKFENAQVVKLL